MFTGAEPFCDFGRESLKEHLCENIGLGGDVLNLFFLSILALVAILISGAGPLKQFW